MGLWFHPAPILSQRFQQLWAEGHIAILAALTLLDMNHHPLAVDVADLEMGQFRATHACGVERHQDGAMKKVTCCIDQPPDLFLAEDGG